MITVIATVAMLVVAIPLAICMGAVLLFVLAEAVDYLMHRGRRSCPPEWARERPDPPPPLEEK